MQSNEQRRVIWRHPKGIYETVEVSGTGVFGVPYSYRETVYTQDRDTRGVARKEVQPAPLKQNGASGTRKAWYSEAEIRSANEVTPLKHEKGAKTS